MSSPSSAAWRDLLHHRDFLKLFVARSVTRFGSTMGQVALIWYVYAETLSPIALTLVGVAQIVPMLSVGLVAGALVDRYERRWTCGVSNLGRAAAMGLLVLALLLLGFDLPFLLSVVLVFSLLSTFMGPASTALLPQIIPKEKIANANGLIQASENTLAVVGASVAGVVIALAGPLVAFSVDATTFLVGGIFVLAITARWAPTFPSGPHTSIFKDIAEGGRYLKGQRGLLELTLSAFSLNFFTTLSGLFFVVFVAEMLRGGALVFGGLSALDAAGTALGSVAVGPWRLTRYTGRMWAIVGPAFGLFLGAFIAIPVFFGAGTFSLVALGAVYLAMGAFGGMVGTAWLSLAQAIVPEEYQGRYFSLDNLGSFAAMPAAQILGGVLTAARGVLLTYEVSALGSAGFGAFFATRKELRALSYDPGKK